MFSQYGRLLVRLPSRLHVVRPERLGVDADAFRALADAHTRLIVDHADTLPLYPGTGVKLFPGGPSAVPTGPCRTAVGKAYVNQNTGAASRERATVAISVVGAFASGAGGWRGPVHFRELFAQLGQLRFLAADLFDDTVDGRIA
jgi:hypothetical protein